MTLEEENAAYEKLMEEKARKRKEEKRKKKEAKLAKKREKRRKRREMYGPNKTTYDKDGNIKGRLIYSSTSSEEDDSEDLSEYNSEDNS